MKALTKFSDRSALDAIRRDMDRIFDDISPFSRNKSINGGLAMELWAPDTDLIETETEYLLTADLPGLKRDQINVSYQEHRLTISGERSEEQKEEGKDFLRKERYEGRFTRTFTLPAEVKEDKIKAMFKDGVLKVTIPKAEVKKAKHVQVE